MVLEQTADRSLSPLALVVFITLSIVLASVVCRSPGYRVQRAASIVEDGRQEIDGAGITLRESIEGDAAIIFEHACKLGHESIVSNALARRADLGARMIGKNPQSAAAAREREIEWR